MRKQSPLSLPKDPPAYDESSNSSSAVCESAPMSPASSYSTSERTARNVAYRAAPELQRQIDQLGSSSSLTMSPTSTRTEYFDILPSFQLFQSMLKKNDFEFDENNIGHPPNYLNHDHPIGNQSPDISSNATDTRDESTANDQLEYEDDGAYMFSDNEMEEGLQLHSRNTRPLTSVNGHLNSQGLSSRNSPLTHESYGHSVLDNIDRLPKAKKSPLDIQIFVTKDVPTPNKFNELETKIKEYSSGDFINGYVIITNNLSKPVDFGMFMVSLEGTFKAIKFDPNQQKQRLVLKKFLKMYDLNASYNYGIIPSSAGIEYDPDSKDSIDNCIMGLPDDRVLRPHQRYKKFVTFRFPEMLLDDSCPHHVLRHTMPPPSFGIDESSFQYRSNNIEVNKALGYGCLMERGSPLKVKDNSFDGISVSYSIEAKFIDKQHTQSQETPIQTNDINCPEPGSESKYVVSQSAQYFVRFIPNVESQLKAYSLAYEGLREDTFDNLGIDGMFVQNMKRRSTWDYVRQMNQKIEQEIRELFERSSNQSELKKFNQFNSESQEYRGSEGVEHLKDKRLKRRPWRNAVTSKQITQIFGKKSRKIFLPTVEIGALRLVADVPNKLLLYDTPRLLRRYNHGILGSDRFSDLENKLSNISLTPTLSNIENLYKRNDEKILKEIHFDILFDPSDKTTKPPLISYIDFHIIAWTYNTEYPIPVSFEHDFFYSMLNEDQMVVLDEETELTQETLLKLKSDVNDFISFLKETKTVVSKETFSYLKSLSTMGLKKDILKDYFKRVSHGTDSEVLDNEDWRASQTTDGKLLWKKSLLVPLKVTNKSNYTLVPSFQNCLIGRLYGLQIDVKMKGGEVNKNHVKIEVPILVG